MSYSCRILNILLLGMGLCLNITALKCGFLCELLPRGYSEANQRAWKKQKSAELPGRSSHQPKHLERTLSNLPVAYRPSSVLPVPSFCELSVTYARMSFGHPVVFESFLSLCITSINSLVHQVGLWLYLYNQNI